MMINAEVTFNLEDYIYLLFWVGILPQIISLLIILYITKRKVNHYQLITSRVTDPDFDRAHTNFALDLKPEKTTNA